LKQVIWTAPTAPTPPERFRDQSVLTSQFWSAHPN
jgi:hypothetical protein